MQISIIVAIFFCLWKRNKDKKKRQSVEELERIEEPVIEVDWEEIDRKYESYNPSPNNNPAYSPQLVDDSITDVDYKSTGSPKNLMLKPDTMKIQNPDAVDEENIIKEFPQPIMLQKPYSDR